MRSAIPTFELLIVLTLFLGGVALEGGLAIVGEHCFGEIEWSSALRVAISDHRPPRVPVPEVDWMRPAPRTAASPLHQAGAAAGVVAPAPRWVALMPRSRER